MTDMTTTTTPVTAKATDTDASKPSPAPATKPPTITLEQLAKELNILPRDARMLLRLAAKQKTLYPTLGKDHVARQPWAWQPGSKALTEARKALLAGAN
jgi:hypothetical protein